MATTQQTETQAILEIVAERDQLRREVERLRELAGLATPSFLSVEFLPDAENFNNNSDEFTFRLTAVGGQPLKVNEKEVDELTFTIVGPCELADFFSEIERIKRKV